MFEENPWKSFLYMVWILFLLAVIAASNTLEFLHFFIACDLEADERRK